MSPERQAELRQALEQQQRISEARDAVEAVHKIEVTEEYEDPEDMKVTVNLPKYSGITPSYTPSASVNSPSPREPFTPDAQDIPRKITYIDPKQEPSKAWNK